MNDQNRWWFTTLFGLLPDATVGFAYLTDAGWKGFFWTIAALWGVRIFLWLKGANTFEQYFIAQRARPTAGKLRLHSIEGQRMKDEYRQAKA